MPAPRAMYQIVGRYMDGSEVVGYHLQSLESGKAERYNREITAYLVGRGQVSNASGQVYKGELLLRGEGVKISELPVFNENTGELSNLNGVGRVRKNASAADVMTMLKLTGIIVKGRSVVGYEVSNNAGAKKNLSRADVIKLAVAGQIGNARVQMNDGKELLRGVGTNLNELPVVKRMDSAGESAPMAVTATAAKR